MNEYKIYTTSRQEPFSFTGKYRRDLETNNWHYYEKEDGTICHFRKDKLVAVFGDTAESVKASKSPDLKEEKEEKFSPCLEQETKPKKSPIKERLSEHKVSSSDWVEEISEAFNDVDTNSIAIAVLSDTQALIAYRDGGNRYYGTANVITIEDDSIKVGQDTVFNASSTLSIAVTALSTTRALVAFSDAGNSLCGILCVLTVDGDKITKRRDLVFNNSSTSQIAITVLTGTTVMLAYMMKEGAEGYGTANVVSLYDDHEMIIGTDRVFNSGGTYEIALTTLDAGKVLVAYHDAAIEGYGMANVLTVLGRAIVHGPACVFSASKTLHIAVTKLSETQALVAYQDADKSSCGKVKVLTICDGDLIAPGLDCVFNQSHTSDISVTATSATRAQVIYRSLHNGYHGATNVLDILDDAIKIKPVRLFNAKNISSMATTIMLYDKVLAVYLEIKNGFQGRGCLI